MDHKQKIIRLAGQGKIGKAIEEFLKGAESDEDLYNKVIGLSGRYHSNESALASDTVSQEFYRRERSKIRESLTYFLEDYTPPAHLNVKEDEPKKDDNIKKTPEDPVKDPNAPANVFISYSHSDVDVAQKIKHTLEGEGIKVLIDDEQLEAGENISEFIKRMVRESDVTLSLISKRSLLSRWVGMETILSLLRENFFKDKRFIPCAVESEFFNDDFIDVCMDEIYAKIEDYNERIRKRKERSATVRTSDLQSKLDLYQDLYDNFPDIIDRLNVSLTLDVSENNYISSMKKVVRTIKK